MTEQEKRDWVIEGLEFTLEESGWDANKAYDQELMIQVVKDAIALLRAQKPRVMTPEEYAAWIDLPFTERNPVFHEERTERGIVTCWVNTTVCSLHEYGKKDRCWTSRPTDAQREAVKWE